MSNELLYTIAFTLLQGFNDTQRKQILIAYGSATELFNERKKGQDAFASFNLLHKNILMGVWPLDEAEAELVFMNKHDIRGFSVIDPKYPDRLVHIDDAPTLLFTKGDTHFNLPQLISIVGSRQHTIQVNRVLQELLEGLAHLKIGVISGMALGVDGIAHQNSVLQKIPTWGVLAHGLDQIYPSQHRRLAIQMLDQGGLITEFRKNTTPLPFCFPKRNRIVAGMSDITLVVETDLKGGSMITANLASGYQREVFAVPGKIHDAKSSGCMHLIKINKANTYHDPIHFLEMMNWPLPSPPQTNLNPELIQKQLILDPLEQSILSIIQEQGPIHRDQVCMALKVHSSEISGHLLQLELDGYIHLQAGNTYITL